MLTPANPGANEDAFGICQRNELAGDHLFSPLALAFKLLSSIPGRALSNDTLRRSLNSTIGKDGLFCQNKARIPGQILPELASRQAVWM
jgi:hypothetical protein